MDPDRRRISTRAEQLTATGQICWPPPGSYMAATGQDLMAADSEEPAAARPSRRDHQLEPDGSGLGCSAHPLDSGRVGNSQAG